MGRAGSGCSAGRAFSLVELLVTIGVVGALLALLLPALGGAKREANVTAELATQRQAELILNAYLIDHNGEYPYWGEPGTFYAPLHWGPEFVSEQHWDQPLHWGLYLHTLGYEGWVSLGSRAHGSAFEEVRQGDCPTCGWGYGSAHMLTNTVYAQPAFWDEDAPPDKRHHRGMREGHLVYPALKGIVILRGGFGPRAKAWGLERRLVHFGDGHGAAVKTSELTTGVQRGGLHMDGEPVHCTPEGVNGRDL
jgi:hypothetical protein